MKRQVYKNKKVEYVYHRCLCSISYQATMAQVLQLNKVRLLLPNIFWLFIFPFEPFVVTFALLSYSICGYCCGYTCLYMTYKQRNLLSFVLVSIVEHAKETFSVLVYVSPC